jgi:DNA (cytosine-5)-methyltransferase 1
MGFEQAGHECVYSVEWDKHKRRIYSVIFGREPEGQDIRTIQSNELPRADCWCFGAPCQDFSIAGKRKGLKGDRSSLVREVFRLIRETKEEYRPKYLFYENVKGMLSSNKGFDFLEILIEMESLGYDTIEYSLLNSKNFGVPQNRERVFTIGHLRGRSTRKVFPITTTDRKTGNPIKRIAHSKYYRRSYQTFDIEGSSEALDTCQGGGRQPHVYINNNSVKTLNTKDFDGKEPPQQNRVYASNGLMTALSAQLNGRYNILVKEATKKGYVEAYEGDSINLAVPGSKTRRGRVGKGIANTLDTSCNQGTLKMEK